MESYDKYTPKLGGVKMFKNLRKAMTVALTAAVGLTTAIAPATMALAQDGETVLIYSNSLSDERNPWIEERASEAGFDVQFVEGGSGDILNRMLAEKDAAQADVVFGMDEGSFMQLVDEDLLVTHVPAWSGEIPAEAQIGDDYYYPLVEQRIFLYFNPEHISAEEAPANWEDLANNEAFAQQYRVPHELGGGTNQKSVLSILLQHQDPEGEMGISDEGWANVEAYLANGYLPAENEDTQQLFADGTMPINFYFSSGIPSVEEEYGFKVEPIDPEYGVITMREQIGVVNKGEDQDYEAAKAFVDWFGSAEVQGEWAETFGSIPVNQGAAEQMLPRVAELVEATTPMEVDWNFVRENIAGWLEKIELELWP